MPEAAAGDWVERALEELRSRSALERIWARDGSLFSDDPREQALCENRLGWLDAPVAMRERLDELEAFARGVQTAGMQEAVLCGMGGSSLAAEVFSQVLASPDGLRFHVLDTTDPREVGAVRRAVDLRRTVFLIASKSGTTLETDCLRAYFTKELADAGVDHPGRHLVAITDPGSELGERARAEGYRAVFENPPDIGGRYSALSLFGLVPAVLMGIDLGTLLDGAAGEAEASRGWPVDPSGLRCSTCLMKKKKPFVKNWSPSNPSRQ